jgi:hypothetical protein
VVRGLYLSDLTFTDEGNPDTIKIESGEELINFPKHQVSGRRGREEDRERKTGEQGMRD